MNKNTDIEKDICYLYHELAEYSGIMGDLDYHSTYNKDYWKYINVDCDPFIREGSMILLLAMIWDWIDESGNIIETKIESYENSMSCFYPQSDNENRLIDLINNGLDIVQKKKDVDEKFSSDTGWAYNTYVREYFIANSK